MRHEATALVALALSACTAVRSVTVKPSELHALARMLPDEERIFTAVGEKETLIARGEDDVRLLRIPVGRDGERDRSTEPEPWGKLYTLRWGSSVTLTPIVDRGASAPLSSSVPAAEVTGAELQMNRISGGRTAVLVACIVGPVAILAAVFAIAVLSQRTPVIIPLAAGPGGLR
jgi:hypothetical protein